MKTVTTSGCRRFGLPLPGLTRLGVLALAVAASALGLATPGRAPAQYRPPAYTYRPPTYTYQPPSYPIRAGDGWTRSSVATWHYNPPAYRPQIRAWVEPPYRPTWSVNHPYIYRPSVPVYYPPHTYGR